MGYFIFILEYFVILNKYNKMGEIYVRKRLSKDVIWIWFLYLGAGYLNALTLILFSETAVGQTGRMTNMVNYFFQSNYSMALQLLLLSFAFLAGSIISGLIFSRNDFDPTNKYIGWISIVSGLGLVIVDFIPGLSNMIIYYISLLLGIQNSLYISYRDSSVSSTALTSVFSNFGSAIGSAIRGEEESRQRALFFSVDILSHIVGAALCLTVSFYSETLLLEVGTVIYLIIGFYFLAFRNDFTVDGSSVGEGPTKEKNR